MTVKFGATLAVFLVGCTLAAHAAPATVMKPAPDASISRLDPQLDKLIAPGAAIEKVASGFVFLEGPMWHKGEVWFSDLRDNKMYSVTPDGKLTLRIDHSGGAPDFTPGSNRGSNAMVPYKNNSFLMEQHGARRIVQVDSGLNIKPFLSLYDGKRFNSPNDMVFAADGALWFTDPPYGLANQDSDSAKDIKFNAVYRYKDGEVKAVITDLARPNGIGFSPDGKTLYVSNTENNPMIFRYDVAADGSVSNRKTVADLTTATGAGAPDGLRVDSQGDLWATGEGGIRIFSPAGTLLGQIVLPEVAANLAWAGDDAKTVYIMGSTSVYRLKILVAGEKPLYPN